MRQKYTICSSVTQCYSFLCLPVSTALSLLKRRWNLTYLILFLSRSVPLMGTTSHNHSHTHSDCSDQGSWYVSYRFGEIAMFDITLFLTLSVIALIGLVITSITLHHLRLDIDKWGGKVLYKTVLILYTSFPDIVSTAGTLVVITV